MKRVCVAAKTVDNEKGGEADIANISEPPDKVSGCFGCNPKGWHDFSPSFRVVLLADIRDIGFVALLDLSENRDSASRVSLC